MDYICFFDEAGCPGALPSASADVQPALVITGIIVSTGDIASITKDFLDLKRRFFPGKLAASRHFLDHILVEIKGASDLRAPIRDKGGRAKAPLQFIDGTLAILKTYRAKLFCRIWVKGPGQPFTGRSVYTRTVHEICHAYSHFLNAKQATGVMIGDFRNPQLNSTIAHTIFTRKMKATGDEFPRVLEIPTFAHSENHAMLQIADIICSAVIYPMVMDRFCRGYIASGHVKARDALFAPRFAKRVRALQYRYQLKGQRFFSISVNDGIATPKRTAWTLFA